MQKNENIDHGKEFDWGNTSKDYAAYRDIYPDDFYQRIVDLGLCTKGQKALDLGTGTGVLPRNFYKFGASWTGTDISKNQITEAVRLADEANMNIHYFAVPAEDTGLAEHTFDVITACQCFMYFDIPKVMAEVLRLLKPDGSFLILYMAWLPFESEIAKKSEDLVLKYNPTWTGGHYKRFEPKVPTWSASYFEHVNCFAYDVDLKFTRESWHGRMIACRGIGASSLPGQEIECFKKEHWDYMNTVPEVFEIPHYVSVFKFKGKQ